MGCFSFANWIDFLYEVGHAQRFWCKVAHAHSHIFSPCSSIDLTNEMQSRNSLLRAKAELDEAIRLDEDAIIVCDDKGLVIWKRFPCSFDSLILFSSLWHFFSFDLVFLFKLCICRSILVDSLVFVCHLNHSILCFFRIQQGTMRQVNDRCLELFRCSRSEICGQNVRVLVDDEIHR